MFFSKKERLSIEETCVKKDLAASDNKVLVKINLRAPDIRCASKKDPLLRRAKPFYDSLVSTLLACAENEIFKAATAKFAADPDARPAAAVMNWRITYLSDKYASFITDISVSDGANAEFRRRTQIWDRESGQRVTFSFLPEKARLAAKRALYPEGKAKDPETFALCEEGIEFFAPDGGRDPGTVLTFETLGLDPKDF